MFDFFNKTPKKEEPPSPSHSAAAAAAAESAQRASGSFTATALTNKEMVDLQAILEDGAQLEAAVRQGLDGQLLETAVLRTIHARSERLLRRNEAREAASAFGQGCLAVTRQADDALAAAVATVWPAYFRQTGDADGDERAHVSKLYLHGLGGGSTLSVRFALTERANDGDALCDLSLAVNQVHPFVAGAPRYKLSFELQDVAPAAAGSFLLDEAQRARLAELKTLLGFKESLWTPVAVLGFVLCAATCGQLGGAAEDDAAAAFVAELLAAMKKAHRDEILDST